MESTKRKVGGVETKEKKRKVDMNSTPCCLRGVFSLVFCI